MRYLVKLKPLDKFFFGRNQTFEENNYFAKSSFLPQQTQILGMLRREILIQNGFLTQKRRGEWVDKYKTEEAKEYVGYERFNIDTDIEQNFGIIKKLSPIFLIDEDEQLYYFSAKDYGIEFKSLIDDIPEIRFKKNNKIYTQKGANELTQKLISLDKEYKLQDIFIDDMQIGINKSQTGATNDNSFFKKTSYRLNKKFVFSFVLELRDDFDYRLDNTIVTLGGERSLFEMQLIPNHSLSHSYIDNIKQLYTKETFDKLILISDSYIKSDNSDIFSKSDFAITGSVPFRTINSKVTRYKSKKDDLDKYYFKKSDIYNLFERGSLFYAPTQELKELITNSNLQKIGYNRYIIIKGEQKNGKTEI